MSLAPEAQARQKIDAQLVAAGVNVGYEVYLIRTEASERGGKHLACAAKEPKPLK